MRDATALQASGFWGMCAAVNEVPKLTDVLLEARGGCQAMWWWHNANVAANATLASCCPCTSLALSALAVFSDQ